MRGVDQRLEASPFRSPGWIKFNELKWGLRARELSFKNEGSGVPEMRMTLYLGKNGRIRPVPHQLFHPVVFKSTTTKWPYRLENQWLKATSDITAQMLEIGLSGQFSMDVPVADLRAWQWSQFRAETLYTHVVDFPFDLANTSSSIRNALKKAGNAGYVCERTNDAQAVMNCVNATEKRQGFTHGITVKDIRLLQQLMGRDHCRFYVCRSTDGSPVASEVVLLGETGDVAIEWLAGSIPEHHSRGPHHFLTKYIYEELQSDGLSEVNLAGSNMPNLSAYKSEWGGRLTQYYSITQRGMRSVLADCKSIVQGLS